MEQITEMGSVLRDAVCVYFMSAWRVGNITGCVDGNLLQEILVINKTSHLAKILSTYSPRVASMSLADLLDGHGKQSKKHGLEIA